MSSAELMRSIIIFLDGSLHRSARCHHLHPFKIGCLGTFQLSKSLPNLDKKLHEVSGLEPREVSCICFRVLQKLWENGISPLGNTPRCANAQRLFPLDAVDTGEEVLVRVQVEYGREEVNNREKQEKDRMRTQPTDSQTHIMDGMKMG